MVRQALGWVYGAPLSRLTPWQCRIGPSVATRPTYRWTADTGSIPQRDLTSLPLSGR